MMMMEEPEEREAPEGLLCLECGPAATMYCDGSSPYCVACCGPLYDLGSVLDRAYEARVDREIFGN